MGFGGWEGLSWVAVLSSKCSSPLYKGQSVCLSPVPLHTHIRKQPGWRGALGGRGWQGQGLQRSPHNWERFRAIAHFPWSCGSSLAQSSVLLIIKHFFIVIKTHNIKLEILSIWFNNVKYIHVVVKQSSGTFSSWKLETL